MNFIFTINFKFIIRIAGLLAMIIGLFMLLAAGVSWYYEDGILANLLISGVITLFIGTIIILFTKNHRKEIQSKEGYLIVTFCWIFMALIGTLPYLLSGEIPDLPSAFFESMSGFTTTGATVIDDIEAVPKGILFWRSFTNWIGGMGMIVLAIAILPLLGIGGMQLFTAESPGPDGNKLSPRISNTAKKLWIMYVGYTLAETIVLKLLGMSLFDAASQSMTSLSTGGFSTKNNSIAYWNNQPLIQYTIILFMFLGGTNFVLSYFGLKLKFKKIFKDEEFRLYGFLVLFFTAISTLILYIHVDLSSEKFDFPLVWGNLEGSFRHSLFQVVSIMTTTGFITADFTIWTPFLTVLFLGIMLLGASAGSTSGGPKVIRYLVMLKNSLIEFKKILHPRAIIPLRYNKKTVPRPIAFKILGFFILYILSFTVGTLVFALLGLDLLSAAGGAASSLGNVGPGLGTLGPIENFDSLPPFGKWWSSFLMLIGRLELFTVLILFTPYFWRIR